MEENHVQRRRDRDGLEASEEAGEAVAIDVVAEARIAEDAEFERVMAIGRKVMSDHHAVLAALAK